MYVRACMTCSGSTYTVGQLVSECVCARVELSVYLLGCCVFQSIALMCAPLFLFSPLLLSPLYRIQSEVTGIANFGLM